MATLITALGWVMFSVLGTLLICGAFTLFFGTIDGGMSYRDDKEWVRETLKKLDQRVAALEPKPKTKGKK